jgi:hypothetical protein
LPDGQLQFFRRSAAAFADAMALSVISILCVNAAMYADGHLTAFEDEQLQKLLAGMGFTEESNRQREFDAAVTRIWPAPHHFLVAVPALWADDWKHDE